ncbi:MAG: ArsR family transcriptional regulator, partial [Candidatus Marinimicrobia bacterium]|nr:ArsR family transcriptional regulator [Candidatus Neomarinimicrobiota bacterium]
MRIDNIKCCDGKMLKKCRSLLGENLFKAFNDESRQQIFLILLSSGEMTVNQVCEKIHINQSNVSR